MTRATMPHHDLRPLVTERVRVRTSDHDALARVTVCTEDAIWLEGVPASGEGAIIFSHPRGVICIDGSFAADGDGAVFTPGTERRLKQRRSAYRLPIGCEVRVTRAGGDGLNCRSADLSLTGIRLLGASRLEHDEVVELTIELGEEADHPTIEVAGRVLRREGDGRVVAFSEVPRPVEDALGAFIAAEQRRRLLRL